MIANSWLWFASFDQSMVPGLHLSTKQKLKKWSCLLWHPNVRRSTWIAPLPAASSCWCGHSFLQHWLRLVVNKAHHSTHTFTHGTTSRSFKSTGSLRSPRHVWICRAQMIWIIVSLEPNHQNWMCMIPIKGDLTKIKWHNRRCPLFLIVTFCGFTVCHNFDMTTWALCIVLSRTIWCTCSLQYSVPTWSWFGKWSMNLCYRLPCL